MKLKLRSMLTASKGNILLAFDLSQAESWIVAYLSGDPNMKDALLNGDIHTRTASIIFSKPESEIERETERYLGKQTNHASAYGEGPETMATSINSLSDQAPYVTVTVKQCRNFSNRWFEYYVYIRPWWQSIKDELYKSMTLRTPYGRKRMFFDEWGHKLFGTSFAYIPQSTVADHFNGAVQPELGINGGLLGIYKAGLGKSIIQQGHDSCILDIKPSLEQEIIGICRHNLSRPLLIKGEQFTIPVDGECGTRWGEMEKIKK